MIFQPFRDTLVDALVSAEAAPESSDTPMRKGCRGG